MGTHARTPITVHPLVSAYTIRASHPERASTHEADPVEPAHPVESVTEHTAIRNGVVRVQRTWVRAGQ